MQVKYMTLNQLRSIITNGYRGDVRDGSGHDYVDYIDEINERYWYLTNKKFQDEIEDRLDAMASEEYEQYSEGKNEIMEK